MLWPCVGAVMADLGTPSHFRSEFGSLFCLAPCAIVLLLHRVHSSVSKDVASSAAAVPSTDKYEAMLMLLDSATAVMPTSSFCRASPRVRDHLKQGPTLMIVSLLPLGTIV